MKDEELKAIEERAAQATPGPWEAMPSGGKVMEDEWGVFPPYGERGPVALVSGEPDARFMSAAREDVLALIAEIKDRGASQSLSLSFGRFLRCAADSGRSGICGDLRLTY